VSERDRQLWTAIRRALMMVVTAIDNHLKEPATADKR
jgi:hypothetical protein